MSVIRIITEKKYPSIKRPWITKLSSGHGTGFIIKGHKIVTNYHVAESSVTLEAFLLENGKSYPAEYLYGSFELDLAILTVKDKNFWKNAKEFELCLEFPQIGDTFKHLGFSLTETLLTSTGDILRIENVIINDKRTRTVSFTTDIMFHLGSSGGPILNSENQVIAIANAIGDRALSFCVPSIYLAHLIYSQEKFNNYLGLPTLGINIQPITNQAIKQNLDVTCIRVRETNNPQLQIGDLITEIEHLKVTDNGMINFRKNEYIYINYLYINKFVGDKLTVKLYRNGKPMTINVSLVNVEYLRKQGINHEYVLYGGLCFIPLNTSYYNANTVFYTDDAERHQKFPGEQMIFLSHIEPSGSNAGYTEYLHHQITHYNDIPIKNISHLKTLISSNKKEYSVFRVYNNSVIALNAKQHALEQ